MQETRTRLETLQVTGDMEKKQEKRKDYRRNGDATEGTETNRIYYIDRYTDVVGMWKR